MQNLMINECVIENKVKKVWITPSCEPLKLADITGGGSTNEVNEIMMGILSGDVV